MSALVKFGDKFPACSAEELNKIATIQDVLLSAEQIAIRTEHILHGGMYARTIHLAAGVVITGALIRVPTVVTINGSCRVLIGDWFADVEGYHVLPASAGRKQIFLTRTPTDITMIFATKATTVEEAEEEFTEEYEKLISRHSTDDIVTITGE